MGYEICSLYSGNFKIYDMKTYTNNYPDSVQEFANKVMVVLDYISFFQKTFNPDLTLEEKQMFFNCICKDRLGNFLKGIELEFESDKESTEVIDLAVAMISLNRLKDKGFVDSIENEHGEEVFFLTPKGKEIVKNNGNYKTKEFIIPK